MQRTKGGGEVTFKELSLSEFIGIREARDKIGEILKSGKTYIVTHHGKPISVLINYREMIFILESFEKCLAKRKGEK